MRFITTTLGFISIAFFVAVLFAPISGALELAGIHWSHLLASTLLIAMAFAKEIRQPHRRGYSEILKTSVTAFLASLICPSFMYGAGFLDAEAVGWMIPGGMVLSASLAMIALLRGVPPAVATGGKQGE